MTDPTITIAGLRAQITSLSDACRALGADCVESIAQANSARAGLAAVTAERDALAAQLAEVRATAEQLDRDLSKSWTMEARAETIAERDKLRADLASERAHLAACRTRIAGLERAADERSAEVARLTARVAELEARPVLTVELLTEALAMGEVAGAFLFSKLGPVTLPLPAQDRAEELTQAIHGTPREEVNPAMWRGMVTLTRSALASLGAPPTSPTVAPTEVFAGVSVGDLESSYRDAEAACRANKSAVHLGCCRLAGIAAVLARLKVTLVAPVDPEAVLRAGADEPGACVTTYAWPDAVRAVRLILTAAGVPVTPERK